MKWFLTKFVRKDHKKDEDYWYNTAEEALDHLRKFIEEDSNLYEKIVASDEMKNTVLQILVFNAEGKATSYMEGDVVRFNPAYCKEGERRFICAITNLNDRTMRANIVCLNSGRSLPFSESVGFEMIDHVGTTVAEIMAST